MSSRTGNLLGDRLASCDAPALLIEGGRPLEGVVRAAGSKNAALPILAASLLTDEPLRVHNVPRLTDVDTMLALLEGVGVEARESSDSPRTLTLHVRDARPTTASRTLIERMRAGFCLLGPMLAKRGEAILALPGGCAIGRRPIDLHLQGLASLGAEIRLEDDHVHATAQRLRGAVVRMSGPRGSTVTGTMNVLSAAVLAKGETTIRDAALEPEVVELGRLLQAMGARIRGLGTSILRVRGVERLHGAECTIPGDRIEAATLLMAAAATRGRVTVDGVEPTHLSSVIDLLRNAGATVGVVDQCVTVSARDRLRAVGLIAAPYPEAPTDLQAQWSAAMSTATGSCVVVDRVFPSRFAHVEGLRRMGADVMKECGRAVIRGVERLHGAEVEATDLRAGAAMVIAGLLAEGRTTVRRVDHLQRGYERLEDKLVSLGADVVFVTGDVAASA